MILRRRFDPEETLRATAESRAEVLAVVPVMMQRILELPEETLRSFDLSALRITSVSGSALPGEMAIRWMDLFGDNVYNLYGSTEVAYATIASPQDLRAAPGHRRPPAPQHGGEDPRPRRQRAPAGRDRAHLRRQRHPPSRATRAAAARRRSTGCSPAATSATSTTRAACTSSGRDDEMIVSGGENVFPREVEDLLSEHDAVYEVAVIGVDDEEFGQRLQGLRRHPRQRAAPPRTT